MKQTGRIFGAVAAVLALLAMVGCRNLNGTHLEPLLGKDINVAELGVTVADSLLDKLPVPMQPHQPVLVTTLVNNDTLDATTSFGRSLQNSIASGLVARGVAVREIKLGKDLVVEVHQGEFMLTRSLRELANKQQAQAVVVGTYAMANRVMYLSVRLVNPVDQRIRSFYEDRIVLDEDSLRMLGLRLKKKTGGEEIEVLPPAPSTLDDMLY